MPRRADGPTERKDGGAGECGGERTTAGRLRWRGGVARWSTRGGERRSDFVALWQCGRDGGAVNGEEWTTGKVGGERICKWRFGSFDWCRGPSTAASGWTDILSTTIPIQNSCLIPTYNKIPYMWCAHSTYLFSYTIRIFSKERHIYSNISIISYL
jgi:hypothetical protein